MINQVLYLENDENDDINIFYINLEAERMIWWNIIYGKYISKVEACFKYYKNSFSLIDKNSILNIIVFCINNKICKSHHSLRYNTFFW